MKIDLSPEGWGRVVAYTVGGTLICIGATLYVDSANFPHLTDAERMRTILIDVLLPILLAVPLLLFFSLKLRELAIAHKKLTVYASTDSLTQVLNRAAFSTLVDAYLKDVHTHDDRYGALLIVDADNFKSVNDTYGHDRGDEALITIARSIKSMLRSPDLVGRMGGEEFGVFLPGATTAQAELVAERIRRTVAAAPFAPGGTAHQLSVSVGGAVFRATVPFHDLFRAADQELYRAKQAGRNRVAVTRLDTGDPSLVAA